jgi:hypothetical protein
VFGICGLSLLTLNTNSLVKTWVRFVVLVCFLSITFVDVLACSFQCLASVVAQLVNLYTKECSILRSTLLDNSL